MAQLPIDTRLKTEKMIEDEIFPQEQRAYLGLSGIGKKCSRTLWYDFRMCSKGQISARIYRLFQRGHREESIIKADLRKIGIQCLHEDDPQIEVVTGHGHIKGHLDDILTNVPDAPKTTHLGEYKTHNNKSFLDLKKKGVRLSKPVHAAQMDCYMYLKKLTRALYVAVNKDNDERYYERLSIDIDSAKSLIQKGIEIIKSETPLARIGGPNWYECKWCNHYQICHFDEPILKNCRTCKHSDIHDEGKWKCSGYKIELTFDQQKIGCERYKILEGLA